MRQPRNGSPDPVLQGNVRDEALRRIARALAIRDPERAEKWAAGLADEAERQSALGEVCLRIAQTDAGDAVRRIARHPLGNSAGGLLENLIQQWAGQDFPAAATWTLAHPAGEQREQLCVRLAIVQAGAQPADAARLLLKEIPEGPIQTEALISISKIGLANMEINPYNLVPINKNGI